jgi:hypothetical protein
MDDPSNELHLLEDQFHCQNQLTRSQGTFRVPKMPQLPEPRHLGVLNDDTPTLAVSRASTSSVVEEIIELRPALQLIPSRLLEAGNSKFNDARF